MIELAARFVPAADEVWRLQRDDDPECRWFRQVVRGAPDPSRGTMQGTYMLTASGALLGKLNSTNPEHVLRAMETALGRWEALDEGARAAAAPAGAAPRHRWEDSYPEAGLVLERFARDVGVSPDQAPSHPVNSDAVWFSADELRRLLPERLAVGAARDVDTALVARLARFAFVDNVRGQTLPFAATAVEVARLRAEVAAVEGDLVRLQLTGTTRVATDGTEPGEDYWQPKRAWPRSVQTQLHGSATWNVPRGRFDAFDVVALGSRTGRTTFNGRSRELSTQPFGIGFLLRLAPAGYRVAPTYVNLYGAPWVKMPGR